MCDIYIHYSTLEYDVMLGIVVGSQSQKIVKGQRVIVFYTCEDFKTFFKDPLRRICVPDKYVFAIPEHIFDAKYLPVIKYGCVLFQFPIKVTAPQNVLRLYERIKKKMGKTLSNATIDIKPNTWIIDRTVYDIQSYGFTDVFLNNISYVLDMIRDYNIMADIIYVNVSSLRNNMLEFQELPTRFFVVLSFV